MINIIPKPNKIIEKEGYISLKKDIKVNKNKLSLKAVQLLSNFFNIEEIQSIDEKNIDILFVSLYENKIDGSYKIDIDDNIKIYSNSESGFLYAIESVRQLLPISIENNKDFKDIEINKCIIEDYPRYSYRGFMLDSCRHFFSKEFVMKKLDEMAMLKLNKFHFHLSDDQGWRIDLPDYPKLKEISSIRKRTKIDGGIKKTKYDVYEEKEYGGIYSISDLKEIVNYAESLCIDVIPEIDSPGHLSAFLAAYPEYSCKGHDINVKESGGVYKDILCLGNQEGVDFMYKVIDQVCEIFPSHHIHIGGDEAPLDEIKSCPKCIEKMKELGLKSALELKYDYSNKLTKRLMDKGYKVTGWNEIINPNFRSDAYIQLWTPFGTKKTIEAVNNGQKVIDSSFFSFYLDYAYELNSLKKSYSHNPSDLFKNNGWENVVGVESPLWTEWVRDENRANWQTYPRLCATAETGWTENINKNYDDFLKRVKLYNERLDALKVIHTSEECYLHVKEKPIFIYFLSKRAKSNIEYNKYKDK